METTNTTATAAQMLIDLHLDRALAEMPATDPMVDVARLLDILAAF